LHKNAQSVIFILKYFW